MARPSKGISPKEIVARFEEQMGRGNRLKTVFAQQILGKFSVEQLNGLKESIDREFDRRVNEKANALKSELEAMGYTVSKK